MTLVQELQNKGSEQLNEQDILALLTARGDLQQELFGWAREVRRERGADKVLLRGVIEISNVCRKNCSYCAMRSSNKDLNRYLLQPDEILAIATGIKEAGVKVVFLQGGQNPGNDELLAEVIPAIKNELKLGVLLCLGERPPQVYQRFARLGADSYILKFETSDTTLYEEISQIPLARRLEYLHWVQRAGLKLGTGNIVGLPNQSLASLVQDIRLGIEIDPDFISSSPFIPGLNTPLQNCVPGSADLTLNTMAIWRIALKSAGIPAVSALETVCKDGQAMGLNAGANVITINFTPTGSQSLYKIYSERRFVVSLDHALRTIESAGLTVLQ